MLNKASLTAPQLRLLKIMQMLNYGRIEGLRVRDGEPVFDAPPRITRDVKLGDINSGPRPEVDAHDFALKRGHVELFEHIQRLNNGTVECIEIKGGLPFRLITIEKEM